MWKLKGLQRSLIQDMTTLWDISELEVPRLSDADVSNHIFIFKLINKVVFICEIFTQRDEVVSDYGFNLHAEQQICVYLKV